MMSFKRLLNFSRAFSSWPEKLRPNAVSTKFCKDFKEFYPNLVDKTIMNCKGMEYPSSMRDYCKRVIEYLTVCKLPVQAEFLIYAYELLEKPENITDEKLHQVYALACATEAIQGGWAIQDDKLDNCDTRAGKVSWHLLPDTSNKTVNDTLLVRNMVYEIIRQNLDESIYTEIMDLMNEMNLRTDMGQHLDTTFPLCKDFDKYTMKNFERIAKMKASFYAFNTPIQLALVLCNKASDESFQLVKHLCDDLGVFIQINNDFTEYREFDESKHYIFSSDFENGTCTWTCVKALEKFDEEQKKIFKECYGSSDQEKIRRVIKLYDEVNLKKLYEQEQAKRYDTYSQKVQNLPADSVPSREVFLKVFDFFQTYMAITTKFYYDKN